MRLIKFRGKAIYDGRWVYGLLRMREGMDHAIIEELTGLGHDVELESVGQYTGIKDKNRKEIYEGDIVYCLNTKIKHEVKYEELEDWEGGIIMGFGFATSYQEKLEVIGNIYENPERLERTDG